MQWAGQGNGQGPRCGCQNRSTAHQYSSSSSSSSSTGASRQASEQCAPAPPGAQVSFAWNGFNNAMISNLGMVLRNIYSKKLLGDFKVHAADAGSAAGVQPGVGWEAVRGVAGWPGMDPLPGPGNATRCAPLALPRPQVDGINLFALLSILSIAYCLPAALYFEGAPRCAAPC